jgi:integrase
VLVKINYKEVKIRRRNSQLFEGEDKFTGTVGYSVVGTIDGERIRLSLGTEEKNAALRRIGKLEMACAEGPNSSLWAELEEALPAKTFQFFANRAGYLKSSIEKPLANPTWANLREAFEVEMAWKIERKARGERKHTMSPVTRDRYRHVIMHFEAFLGNPDIKLSTINEALIEMYKVSRYKAIQKLKQARGGSSIALDIAILHGIFRFGVEKQLIARKPIELKNETKPGAYPTNPARPYTADELTKLRTAAVVEPKTDLQKKVHGATGGDLFVLLVMRWTGLRCSDAIRLSWEQIHFDRGVNGEIEILTQKRNKVAIIPMMPELRDALHQQYSVRKPKPHDKVLLNPDRRNGKPFSSRQQLYEYCLSLGRRAEVKRATPHNWRDTFACDMLARHIGIYEVAMMLADTVETVQKSYAKFIPANRDGVQVQMVTGLGIEERGRLAQLRGEKVVAISEKSAAA